MKVQVKLSARQLLKHTPQDACVSEYIRLWQVVYINSCERATDKTITERILRTLLADLLRVIVKSDLGVLGVSIVVDVVVVVVAAVAVAVFVCLLVGCLTSQQQASVSQGRICSDNFTCCHTEIEVADPTFYLTQSQYTDTGPTSPSADPITPGAWQGSHWSANF